MSPKAQRLAHGTLSICVCTAMEQQRICRGQVAVTGLWFLSCGLGFEWRFIEHSLYLVDKAVTECIPGPPLKTDWLVMSMENSHQQTQFPPWDNCTNGEKSLWEENLSE